MGTLGNQPERKHHDDYDITAALKHVRAIAKENGFTPDQILKMWEILELQRRNNIAVDDGDFRDEQAGGFGDLLRDIAGFGDLLQNIADALNNVASAINRTR